MTTVRFITAAVAFYILSIPNAVRCADTTHYRLEGNIASASARGYRAHTPNYETIAISAFDGSQQSSGSPESLAEGYVIMHSQNSLNGDYIQGYAQFTPTISSNLNGASFSATMTVDSWVNGVLVDSSEVDIEVSFTGIGARQQSPHTTYVNILPGENHFISQGSDRIRAAEVTISIDGEPYLPPNDWDDVSLSTIKAVSIETIVP